MPAEAPVIRAFGFVMMFFHSVIVTKAKSPPALFKPAATCQIPRPFRSQVMRRASYTIAALLLLGTLTSPALAAGRQGLWTMTTTWQFAPPLVPRALVAMSREQG